ncbi:hypothetical protein AB0H73_34540 [Streptomyces olivoreticuli]
MADKDNENRSDMDSGRPHRVRIPGFIDDREVGLGDVIKKATSAAGIKPCGGCSRRAERLNQWMVFSGRHRETKPRE